MEPGTHGPESGGGHLGRSRAREKRDERREPERCLNRTHVAIRGLGLGRGRGAPSSRVDRGGLGNRVHRLYTFGAGAGSRIVRGRRLHSRLADSAGNSGSSKNN